MKEQTDEPIYAEANNNFAKEVSLETTLNILLKFKSTRGLLKTFQNF